MINKTFVTLKLNEINPYPNNPRINDKAVEKVMESIRECENLDPIEVDENNFVLSGHTRLKALRKLGYEETECIQYIGLQEEQKTKYRILANKTQEFAEWDFEMLQSELDSLLDFDAEFYGFEDMMNDLDEAETYEPKMENKGSLREKYIVPPFSVIYGNKPDWFRRKRAWVSFGIRSEIGRGGSYALTTRMSGKESISDSRKAKAYADGLIEKREQIRKGMYRGATV